MSGESVNYADNHYTFGVQRFHESTKTAFKRSLRSDDYFYTLRDIIFFLENAACTIAEYRRKAVENKINAIVENDKSALQDYLSGKAETCTQIDQSVQASYKATVLVKPASYQKKSVTMDVSVEIEESNTSLPQEKIQELRDMRNKQKRKISHISNSSERSAKPSSNLMNKLLNSFEHASKEQIEADRAVMARIRSTDYPAQTRLSIFNSQGTDFAMALKLFNDRVLKPLAAASKDPATPVALTPVAVSVAPATPSTGSGRSHIIIVPNSFTSLLNMNNAKDFLEQGLFKAGNAQQTRPKYELLSRAFNGRQVLYKIVDSVKELSPADWQRVVAVFVTGQAWQLRDFMWKYVASLCPSSPCTSPTPLTYCIAIL
jgi:hypothetical protein